MTLGQRLVLMWRFSDSGEAPGGHIPVCPWLPARQIQNLRNISAQCVQNRTLQTHKPLRSAVASFAVCVPISVNGAAHNENSGSIFDAPFPSPSFFAKRKQKTMKCDP